jgi:glycosyltransferase involved in cell wall biosynthesis
VAEQVSASVVVPCWRAGATIARAVSSVAAQSVRPLELLLIDDASGDGSVHVLQSIAEEYGSDWVRVIEMQANGGPGPARNAGWDRARGEYVAFLDADDAWHPRKLEVQYEWMIQHPDVPLCGHPTVLWAQGQSMPVIPPVLRSSRINLLAMLVANRFPTRSVMIRRDVPFRFGDRGLQEDYLLWLQVIASGSPCYILHAPLAMAFKPEYSPGGYSGHLWTCEERELMALATFYKSGGISAITWAAASVWSLCKYVRREIVAATRWVSSPNDTRKT